MQKRIILALVLSIDSRQKMGVKHWLALLFLLAAGGMAQATKTLNIDEITDFVPDNEMCTYRPVPGAACTKVPAGFAGFTWTDTWIINGCIYAPGSYLCHDPVRKTNVLVFRNGPGNTSPYGASLNRYAGQLGEDFNFLGARMSNSANNYSISFAPQNLRQGYWRTPAITATVTTSPQQISLNFPKAQDIRIAMTETVQYLAMDNIRYDYSLCNSTSSWTFLSYATPVVLGNQVYLPSNDFSGCMGEVTVTHMDRTGNFGGQAQNVLWPAGCALSGIQNPTAWGNFYNPDHSTASPCSRYQSVATNDSGGSGVNLQGVSNNYRALGFTNRILVTVSPQTGATTPLFNESFTASNYTNETPGGANAAYGNLSWLKYIAGDASNEGNGTFRIRGSQLGDIVNANPVPVGHPNSNYDALIKDLLTGDDLSTEAADYAIFKASNANRTVVLYQAANDGFLHAFRSGVQNSDGNIITNSISPNDGKELLAYSPSNALSTLAASGNPEPDLRYSDPGYDHNYFVDATPGFGDAYVNGHWQTWLFGGLGPGGNAAGPVIKDSDSAAGLLYAVNITDPGNFSYSGIQRNPHLIQEVNSGAAGVAGVRNAQSINCTSATGALYACDAYLGAIYGTPEIRRMHNGHWNAILGNGLFSQSGKGGIFIVNQIDNLKSGDNYYLNAPAAIQPGQKNGIVEVTPADLDGDGVIDYIYAGDVLGNVWRYDVTSSNPATWASTAPVKIFPAGSYSAANLQPITTKVMFNRFYSSAGAHVVIEFGTGRRRATKYYTQGNTWATGIQSIYGILDWQLSAWNNISHTKYNSVLDLPANATLVNQLVEPYNPAQEAWGTAFKLVQLSPVCWIGAASISGCTNYHAFGWKIDLLSTDATINSLTPMQLASNPVFYKGIFIANTFAPLPLSNQINPPALTLMIASNGGSAQQNITGLPSPGDPLSLGMKSYYLGSSPLFFVASDSSSHFVLEYSTTSIFSGGVINMTPFQGTLVDSSLPPSKKRIRVLTWRQLR